MNERKQNKLHLTLWGQEINVYLFSGFKQVGYDQQAFHNDCLQRIERAQKQMPHTETSSSGKFMSISIEIIEYKIKTNYTVLLSAVYCFPRKKAYMNCCET